MKCTKMIRVLVFLIAFISVGLLFQNCAKNPNLPQYSQQQSSSGSGSTSSASTGTPSNTPQNQIPPPTVAQPVSANYTVTAGQSLVVQATANGSGLTYQWYDNGQALTSGANGYAFSSTGDQLSIANVVGADAGNYSVTISNSAGSINESFSIIVNQPAPTVPPPVITVGPANVTVNNFASTYMVGQTSSNKVTFSVQVSGSNLSYQWYHNGSAISGANAATYSFAMTSSSQEGTYSVAVSNPAGTVSAQAQLTVVICTQGSFGLIYCNGTLYN